MQTSTIDKWFCAFFFFASSIAAEKVDILSNFHLDELDPVWKIRLETFFDVRSLSMGSEQYLKEYYTDEIDKLFVMNGCSEEVFARVPREKLVLVLWEPGGIGPDHTYCDHFIRTYTYNDLLIDNKRYYKYCYPVLLPRVSNIPDFDLKKFSVMIAHSWSKLRVQLIHFFEQKSDEDFEFFGFTPLIQSPKYRGAIPGHPVCNEKLEHLKNYRFSICFENSAIPGYVTEKIFACFAGGCVPVYWGAPNIEEYVPKNCFIDYRDFSSDEELYQYLKAMPRSVYEGYMERIGSYLQSKQARQFSAERFNEIILEAVLDE